MKIGIVGHRFLDCNTKEFITQQFLMLLSHVKMENKNVFALSAIAEGADTLFAKSALNLNIPLTIVQPFHNYEDDFVSEESKETFFKLYLLASTKVILDNAYRTEDTYVSAMNWIVDNSDTLIAVWDGKCSDRKGNTAYSVNRAIEMKLPWYHVDVINKRTTFYDSNKRFYNYERN